MIHLVFEIIFMCATETYISKCLKDAVDLMTWSVSNCQENQAFVLQMQIRLFICIQKI